MPKVKSKKAVKVLPWDRVRGFSTRLYHTLQGPVIGKVEKETATSVRIWAPARLATPNPATVFYLPVAFVETWLDLRWAVMFGASDIPDAIARGYEGYFEEFLKGSYKMAPVAVQAGIEGEVHQHADNDSKGPIKVLEPCPACHQPLSAWNAHYPVLVREDSSPELVVANGDNGKHRWMCEISVPDIRERFPDYDAPKPSNAE